MSAKKVLDKLGLDMTSAITVYLKQIVNQNGIPFKIVTENGLTLSEEKAILKAIRDNEQGKNYVETNGWEETKTYLDSLKK